MDQNPYAAPQIEDSPIAENSSEKEVIRKELISHEASIKTLGFLYILGAGLWLVAGIFSSSTFYDTEPTTGIVVGGITLGISALLIFVGVGLRRLKPWARVVAGIFCGLGLLGFPIGTIINGYFLYLLFSQKGVRVFSAEYKEIITATPDVKFKTSKVTWIVLGVFLLVVVGLIVAASLDI